MKKTILLVVCLIGLGFSTNLFAQQDLDIVNNTSCSFSVSASQYNPSGGCTAGVVLSTTAGASSSFTLVFPGPVPTEFVLKCTVSNACDAGSPVSDFGMCGGGKILTTTLNSSACCAANVTVTFTAPTASTNAIVTIN